MESKTTWKTITFLKCFFCCKNFKMPHLIEMNNNSVLINEEELSYTDLILDVCLFKVSDDSKKNFVCNECNDKLLSFHFFKRDVKKYNSFREHLEKLEILSKAEQFLQDREAENLDGIKVVEDTCNFTISFQNDITVEVNATEGLKENSKNDLVLCNFEESSTQKFEVFEESKLQCLEPTTVSEIEQQKEVLPGNPSITDILIKEENSDVWNCPYCDVDSYTTRKSFNYHIKSNHTDQEETIEMITEEFLFLEYDDENQSVKKRKVNTLNDLSEEQINWVRKEVKAGEMLNGRKKSYKCTVCECVLSSQASLTRHLRDLHVLQKKQERTTIKQEVNNSKLMVSGVLIWKCLRCENDQIYKSEQSFKIHLRMKHIRATKVNTAFVAACKTTVHEPDGFREVWKCPNCSRIFRQRDSLRNHIKLEHPNMNEEEAKKRMEEERATLLAASTEQSNEVVSRIIKKLEAKETGKSLSFCNECGLKFATAKQHQKPKVHRECHDVFKILASQVPSYKCELCQIIFNSEASCNYHLMVHDTPEGSYPIPAEGLSQYGASVFKIPKGDADDAVDEAVWKCGHCPVRYFEESDCVTHIMLLHSSPLYCFLDNREFCGSTGMSKYVQHMKNKHPELFPDLKYPCGSCKREFQTIYEKLAHQKVCSNKKFECDHCDKRFQNKYQLQSHILYELGLSGVSCEFCGKRCKTMSDMKIHQNVHSQARPYECSLCLKAFKTPGARSSHMESHNGGIDCEICGVKLVNRTLYQRHKRFQHNNEFREIQHEKNVCTLCGKSFLRTAHFKQHMKRHGIQQV